MRKIKRNVQISVIIIFYACIIFCVFMMCVFHIQHRMNQKDALSYLDTMVEDHVENQTKIDEEMFLNDPIKAYGEQRMKDLNSLKEYYDTELIFAIIPSAILFCVFTMFASWLLWWILKKFNQRKLKEIAQSIESIQKDRYNEVDDPSLQSAFEKIRQEYEQHFEDYKRLTSYLTHEQKNVLALLRSNLELGHTKESYENLNQLSEGIDDILTMAEQKNQEAMEEVDVIMMCAQVVDRYANIYPNINFEFDESDTSMIYAKKRWITRAISNLVDNAIKYGEGKPVEVVVYRAHHSVVVKVSDHGVGIKEEEQEKIFQHQYRIHELKKDGYGIGLSLVQHVCELCGGFVYVESKPHIETSFYLSFPVIECI